MIRCCKDCIDRYVGCHTVCEIYINEKQIYEEQKEVERKYKHIEGMLNSFKTEAIDNFRKGRGRKR